MCIMFPGPSGMLAGDREGDAGRDAGQGDSTHRPGAASTLQKIEGLGVRGCITL